MGDEIGVQNSIVHFWNLHIHIFRKNLCSSAMPKVFEYLKMACDALQTQKQIYQLYQSTKSKKNEKVVKGAAPVKDKGKYYEISVFLHIYELLFLYDFVPYRSLSAIII
jgi:hypothetical protein